VKLKESAAEPKQEALVEKTHTSGQHVPVDQVKQPDVARKPDVRQEPPVPVEPLSGAVVEEKEVNQEKDVIPAALQDGEQQVRMNTALSFYCSFVILCPCLELQLCC
jgi:hypothetical protein